MLHGVISLFGRELLLCVETDFYRAKRKATIAATALARVLVRGGIEVAPPICKGDSEERSMNEMIQARDEGATPYYRVVVPGWWYRAQQIDVAHKGGREENWGWRGRPMPVPVPVVVPASASARPAFQKERKGKGMMKHQRAGDLSQARATANSQRWLQVPSFFFCATGPLCTLFEDV